MHEASRLLLALLLTGVVEVRTWWTPPRDAMADASNELGLALLQDFVSSPGNVALSPLAAAATLVALWEGARGDTALQLRRALELPEDRDRVRAGFRDLHRLLRARHSEHRLCLDDLLLLSADAVPLEPAYVDVLRFYGYQLANGSVATTQESTTGPPRIYETAPPTTTAGPEETVPGDTAPTTIAVPATSLPEGPPDAAPGPATTIAVPVTSLPEVTDSPGAPPGATTTIAVPVTSLPEVTDSPGAPPGATTTIAVPVTSLPEVTESPGPPPGVTTPIAVPVTSLPEVTESPGPPPGATTTVTSLPETIETAAASPDAVQGPTTTVAVPAETTESPGVPTDAAPAPTTTVPVPVTSPPEVAESPGAPPDTFQAPATTVAVEATSLPQMITQTPGVPPDAAPGPATTVEAPSPSIQDATERTTVPASSTAGTVTTTPLEAAPPSVPEATVPLPSDLPSTLAPDTAGTPSSLEVPSTSSPEGTETPGVLPFSAGVVTTFVDVPETTAAPSVDVPSTVAPETTPGLSIASEVPETSETEEPRSRRAILGPSSRRLQSLEVAPFLVRGALQRLVPALRTSGRLPFARIDALRACVLQIPLQDASYRVLLVLPETPEDLPTTVAALRRFPLRQVVRRLRTTAVNVAVPLFRLHGVVLLTSTLQHLGVWDVFDPRRADLSCMSVATPLFVVNVAQRVDLDLRPRPLQARGGVAVEDAFVADRAFLFFVLDAVADVALLAGKVEDPLSTDITWPSHRRDIFELRTAMPEKDVE